jgi:hypothetical protein
MQDSTAGDLLVLFSLLAATVVLGLPLWFLVYLMGWV